MRHPRAAALAAALLLTACEGEEEGGPDMQPGSNCLASGCHAGGEHAFTAAGTVFTGGDSTVGLGGATVTITPASGAPVTLVTRASGNFYTSAPLTPPLTISVSDGTDQNDMVSPAPSGACGACHQPAASQAARVHAGTCSATACHG
jgi:hypothetical protein